MATDHENAEKNAQALLKFALGNHNAKRYKEAAGFYEVILKRYPHAEAAKYAQTNLTSLVNKIEGLEPIQPNELFITRIEQNSNSQEIQKNSTATPVIESSKPLPNTSNQKKDTIESTSKIQGRFHSKWKQLRIAENPYLLVGLFFLTALISYFAGREHVKYEIRQAFTGTIDGFRKNIADVVVPPKTSIQSSPSTPIESKWNSEVYNGPFGLKMGMKKSQFESLKETNNSFTYQTSIVPKPSSEFDNYVLRIGEKSGLCIIKAISAPFSTNRYGFAVKEKFDFLKTALAEKYGPHKIQDFLLSGSIWKESEDFMMGLMKEERYLRAYWDAEEKSNLSDNLKSIMLVAVGLSSEKAAIYIQYEFENSADCREEKKTIESNPL